jgi:hypothetical protein
MLNDRKIKLGLSMRYVGYHVAAWRHPDVAADGAVHFASCRARSRLKPPGST